MSLNESTVEAAALEWFEGPSYATSSGVIFAKLSRTKPHLSSPAGWLAGGRPADWTAGWLPDRYADAIAAECNPECIRSKKASSCPTP
jgi:hypothetical protein